MRLRIWWRGSGGIGREFATGTSPGMTYPVIGMPPHGRRQFLVGGWVALALVGLWLGHTLEYMRVWGTAGLNAELFGSIHAYMLPLAAVIALLASAVAFRLWRVWTALGRRLDEAHTLVRSVLRGRPADVPEAPPPVTTPSFWAGIAAAWPALAVLQIVLYVFQENVEAIAYRMPAPGFGAISGIHALAPLVHAGVSLVLLVATAGALRLLRSRVSTIEAIEAVARALLRALTTRAPRLTPPLSRDVAPPLRLFGFGLRQRPPPPLLAV